MNPDIEDQADDWWARLHAPDGEIHRAAFEEWRSRDPRHAEAFEGAEANWKLLAGLKRPPPIRVPTRLKINVLRPAFALAGVGGALIIGAFLMTRMPNPEKTWVRQEATIQSGSSLRAFRIGDGSVVLLDVQSQVSIDLSGVERKIALVDGRARFSVAHDPLHPFVVSAAGGTITAHGTVFDVWLSPKGSRIVLIEGVVAVDPAAAAKTAKQPLIMTAGETVSVLNATTRVVPTLETDRDWTSANLKFESMSLRKLIALANRHGETPIRLGDGVSGDRTVSGTFNIHASNALSAQLAAALNLRVARDACGILLSN